MTQQSTMPIGARFSRLTIISQDPRRSAGGHVRWLCRCDCGVVTVVTGTDLRRGTTVSCGCLGREKAAERGADRWTQHGLSRSPEYKSWASMIDRCRNPRHRSYADYGGRGILVCPEWDSFERFRANMGERPSKQHSLDRINNDGNYEPGNCRWATRRQQLRNTRSNHFLTHDNLTLTVAEWAERLGVEQNMLLARIRYGWPTERILTEPPRRW
jgi:hypothetical protein